MLKSSQEKELKKKGKKVNQRLKRIKNKEAKIKLETKEIEKKKVNVEENENQTLLMKTTQSRFQPYLLL